MNLSTSILFLIALVFVSFCLTYLIRLVAIKKNVIDVPNERSSHSIPTPRGGGLAIVIAWYSGITCLFLTGLIEAKLFWALLSGVILAIVSLFDDLFSLSPKIRLVTQTITAITALSILGGFSTHFVPLNSTIAAIAINSCIVVAIIWFINLYNFIDGIDAYASVEAIFIVISIFLFTHQIVLLVLAAAILGFLYWNWPKAKIFMGDVGSTQIGFILIILGIYLNNTAGFNFIFWIMLSSLFWFDATFTLFRRWRNKEKLSQAHKKHAYQRFVQAGFSHSETVFYALIVNGIIFILITSAYYYPVLLLPVFIICMLILFAATKITDSKMPFK
jgi:UDP-N-acetylmuramyl pentapeptide phosphotransferase/UDP-N-acetylglucosamine-1-phosphate transferase